MAKKKKVRQFTGDSLHIEFPRRTSGNYYIQTSIILRPTNTIALFGENRSFEWQGNFGNEIIQVTLPRHTSELDAKITNNFPNEIDEHLGTTYEQLYKELRRVLRRLD